MSKYRMVLLILCSLNLYVSGAVVYQEKDNVLWVTDFPITTPCTPEILYRIDQKNGWKKVTYDKASDTYRIDASLWIGNNNKTNTYFQIGNKEHPEETVIVKGNIFIKPYWVKGKNPGKCWWKLKKPDRYINRITLGDPDNDKIKATLKIDNSERKGYTLIVGGGKIANINGGQLHAYNSTITAANPKKKFAIGAVKNGRPKRIFMGGYQGNILKDTTISHGAFMMSYAIFNLFGGVMDKVTFADGDIAVSSGMKLITGCIVKNCRIAVYDMGNMDLTMINCKFENNQVNWYLRYGGKGIILVDCEVGKPKVRNVLLRKRKGNKTVYPRVISKRHIIIKVVDSNGEPVPKAEIKIIPEVTDPEVEEMILAADKTGMTPGKDSAGAILLPDEKIRASDGKIPITKKFTYTIKAEVPWLTPAEIKKFSPAKSWETITIILK